MEQNREKVCVLLSCMHQKDKSIVEKSNIQTDCVVINQCDINKVEEYDFKNKKGEECHIKFVSTTERGLSKSRNIAISYSNADYCLVCDDDEILEDDYESKILKGYQEIPEATVIAFKIRRIDKYPQIFPNHKTEMSIRQMFKSSSQQITFRREILIRDNVFFDEKMGSGTGNGAGEEVKFMMDLKRKGRKIYYYPLLISSIYPGESQWFHGVDIKYLRDKGWAIRRTVGPILGMAYNIYYSISHRNEFVNGISVWDSVKAMCVGWNEKR